MPLEIVSVPGATPPGPDELQGLRPTHIITQSDRDEADVRIRIFTPSRELPFAGHPTLGAAFVLGGPLQKIVLRLETGAGIVPV